MHAVNLYYSSVYVYINHRAGALRHYVVDTYLAQALAQTVRNVEKVGPLFCIRLPALMYEVTAANVQHSRVYRRIDRAKRTFCHCTEVLEAYCQLQRA